MSKTKAEVKSKEQPQSKPRRSKGDGSLFKNSKGKWVARYKGKEFTGDVKSEVKARMDRYKILVQTGEAVTRKLTVQQYGEKFLYHKEQQNKRGKFKNSSLDRLERTFHKQIEESDLAKVLMCNLDGLQIQDFIDNLSSKYSISTIKKAYLFLQAMISFGIEMKDLPKSYDPLSIVELPDESVLEVKTKEIEIMPDEYLPKFKETAMARNPDGSLSYRYGPLLVFALNTGFREGELLALSKSGIMTVDGRRAYHVYETVSTVKNRDKDASTKTGLLPTARNIQLTLDRILKRAGLPHYGTHALRHTFATRLLRKTQNHQELKAVAELLGDDYKVVVKTYLHTEEQGKSGLVDLLTA